MFSERRATMTRKQAGVVLVLFVLFCQDHTVAHATEMHSSLVSSSASSQRDTPASGRGRRPSLSRRRTRPMESESVHQRELKDEGPVNDHDSGLLSETPSNNTTAMRATPRLPPPATPRTVLLDCRPCIERRTRPLRIWKIRGPVDNNNNNNNSQDTFHAHETALQQWTATTNVPLSIHTLSYPRLAMQNSLSDAVALVRKEWGQLSSSSSSGSPTASSTSSASSWRELETDAAWIILVDSSLFSSSSTFQFLGGSSSVLSSSLSPLQQEQQIYQDLERLLRAIWTNVTASPFSVTGLVASAARQQQQQQQQLAASTTASPPPPLFLWAGMGAGTTPSPTMIGQGAGTITVALGAPANQERFSPVAVTVGAGGRTTPRSHAYSMGVQAARQVLARSMTADDAATILSPQEGDDSSLPRPTMIKQRILWIHPQPPTSTTTTTAGASFALTPEQEDCQQGFFDTIVQAWNLDPSLATSTTTTSTNSPGTREGPIHPFDSTTRRPSIIVTTTTLNLPDAPVTIDDVWLPDAETDEDTSSAAVDRLVTMLSVTQRSSQQTEEDKDCPRPLYQVVLTPQGPLLDLVLQARQEHMQQQQQLQLKPDTDNCSNDDESSQQQQDALVVGCFGTDDVTTYQALAVGHLDFAVAAQQPWLEASLTAALATLYQTTGLHLVSSNEAVVQLSTGPTAVTRSSLPPVAIQRCQAYGYPICARDEDQKQNGDGETAISRYFGTGARENRLASPSRASNSLPSRVCPCLDRSEIRLGVVVHGGWFSSGGYDATAAINNIMTMEEEEWSTIQQGLSQAARDMQVQLEMENLWAQDDDIYNNQSSSFSMTSWYTRMANQILSYCHHGRGGVVDGLIISIPSELVLAAVEECQARGVPIISIHSGRQYSQDMGLLHHIGSDKYLAGYRGGQELLRAGAQLGLCLNHDHSYQQDNKDDIGVMDGTEWCRGMQAAFDELNEDSDDTTNQGRYLGMVNLTITRMDEDENDVFVEQVEMVIDQLNGGNWENLGLLITGNELLPVLQTLLETYPGALGGTCDLYNDVNFDVESLLDENDKFVFAMDHQPYLQGYLPVLLLTWYTQTRQKLLTRDLFTGPRAVRGAPSEAEQTCKDNAFSVCLPPLDIELNHLGNIRFLGYFLAIIVLLASFSFGSWVVLSRRKRVVRQSQPFFLIMICIGAALMGSTIFLLGVDDGNSSIKGCDIACMASPWLFTVGFVIAFAALYSKLRRLNKLINNAEHFRHMTVTVRDVMLPFFILLVLNIGLLTSWTFADPMYWWRAEHTSGNGSYGLCRLGESGVSVGMALGIFSVNIAALFLALSEAHKSRKVSFSLSDRGSIGRVVVSMLQIAIVGFPILPLVRDDPSASFLLKSGLVFVISMSTLLFIFVPKLRKRAETEDLVHSMHPRGHSFANHSTGHSMAHLERLSSNHSWQDHGSGYFSHFSNHSSRDPHHNGFHSDGHHGHHSPYTHHRHSLRDGPPFSLVGIHEETDESLHESRLRVGHDHGPPSKEPEGPGHTSEHNSAATFLKELADLIESGVIGSGDAVKAIHQYGLSADEVNPVGSHSKHHADEMVEEEPESEMQSEAVLVGLVKQVVDLVESGAVRAEQIFKTFHEHGIVPLSDAESSPDHEDETEVLLNDDAEVSENSSNNESEEYRTGA